MSTPKNMAASLKSKFRGCLAGVLLGDCIGNQSRHVLREFLNAPDEGKFIYPFLYSDDTTMTKSIAESLIENKGLDEKDIARRFTDDYYKDMERGYAYGILDVFHKWRASNLDDLWGPGEEQFGGEGSWGNGGAMRVSPIPLFCYGNYDQMVSMVISVTKLTHTHELGIVGALFQSIAIQQALELDPAEELDEKLFLKNLKEKIVAIEENMDFKSYAPRIDNIEKLLERSQKEHLPTLDVIEILGNDVCALDSAPTALFCFLRALKRIPEIETENPMRRTIEYAISLGGDTDTIGSMAAALMGSYFGEQVIPTNYMKYMEEGTEIPLLGEKLYDIISPSLSSCDGPHKCES